MATNNVKYVFKGAASTSTRNVWPLRIVAKCIKMWLDGAGKASSIFQSLLPELNAIRVANGQEPLSSLPRSYTNKNAASLHYNMRQRFVNLITSGCKEAIALANEYGLEIEKVNV